MPLTKIQSLGITDGTIVNADINASAAIASTKLSGVTSDFVLLASTDASSSSSISFDGYFSSTYKNYKVIISNMLPATDGTTFRLRYRQSNADLTDSYYISSIDASYTTSSAGGFDYDRVWNASSFRLNGTDLDSTDTLANLNAEFTIYNPLGTSYKKCFTFLGGSPSTNADYLYNYNSYGVYTNSNAALSGVTFFMSSGNITVGNFKLYGIKWKRLLIILNTI